MADPTPAEQKIIDDARKEDAYQTFAGFLKRFGEENAPEVPDDAPKKTTPPASNFFSNLFGG